MNNLESKTSFVVLEIEDDKDILTGHNNVRVIAVFLSRKDAENYVYRYRLGRNIIIQEAVLNPRFVLH